MRKRIVSALLAVCLATGLMAVPTAAAGTLNTPWQLSSSPGFRPVRSRQESASFCVSARWSWKPSPCSAA